MPDGFAKFPGSGEGGVRGIRKVYLDSPQFFSGKEPVKYGYTDDV